MSWIEKIKLIAQDAILRRRILFTIGALVLFRLLSAIPVPGVDKGALLRFFSNNNFFGFLDVFSGGGLSTVSIIMLGVGPYITASIIMQLMTMMIPKLKAMYQEEGDAGRKRFSQYSRLLTVPLAIFQAIAFLALLKSRGVIPDIHGIALVVNVFVITAGSLLLMWIGELITEFGIGNGVSLIIFAGIVATIPQKLDQFRLKYIYPIFDPSIVPTALVIMVIGFLIILGVVYVTEAERPIAVTYAKRVRGSKMFGGVSTYLPLRINQAGVIPIIFALSILLFPQMILNFLLQVRNTNVQSVVAFLNGIFANPWFNSIFYFLLVFLFTYFYTAVTFDPESIATNLQKNGAFIPGVRPGQPTSEHISRILLRITLVGAIFLGLIAVLPLIMTSITSDRTFAIGGTALLIVVSVVLDLMKKLDAQVSMREY